jgi:hypothetical protein
MALLVRPEIGPVAAEQTRAELELLCSPRR